MENPERFIKTVYVLNRDGSITETMYRDLCESVAEQTTAPVGAVAKHHIRNDREVWTWGYMGQFPKLIADYSEHESGAELAQEHLLELHEYDLQRMDDAPNWFHSREEAEAEYKRIAEEDGQE